MVSEPIERASKTVNEQVERLERLLTEQHQRIAELERQRESAVVRAHAPTDQPSRRDLLRRAGVAAAGVAGAAGAMALLPTTAAATQGSAILAGVANTETATTVVEGGAATIGLILKATTTGDSSTYSTAFVGEGVAAADVGVMGTANASDVLTSSTGYAVGVYGQTNQGVGVLASATAYGLGLLAGGARAPISLAAFGTAGHPTAGAHGQGDIVMDSNGTLWACIAAGTPGTWTPLQTGGAGISHFVKVSTTQRSLTGNNGATWVDLDPAVLTLTITPSFNAQAVISGNVDLWTATAGINQDIGVYIEGDTYGAAGLGKIVAWKESGGSAGTFSPNAAFVETTQPLKAGVAYKIKLQWKANRASSGTILAGAGPLPNSTVFSPSRLAVTLIQDVPNPSLLLSPAANDTSRVPTRALPGSFKRGARPSR